MSPSNQERPRGLVTGASSGIGAAFASRLAQDGYDLVLVARRRERLDALAHQLQAGQQVQVEVLPADLTMADDLRRVEQRVARDPAVDLLVNNAGFGGYLPFVELDPDRAEELINLHVRAVTRLTRAALPGMIARGRGAVVNVSSLLAYSGTMPSPPLPKRATYAGAKAYINAFTQVLNDELQGTGVSVQALCPAMVITEFHQTVAADAGLPAPQLPASTGVTAAEVVEASLAGLRLGEVICVPALHETGVLDELGAIQRQIFEQGRSSHGLAPRYRA